MHSFTELVDRSASFALDALNEAESRVIKALETSAATTLVKALQMIQLQKAIIAVGMFSIFEAMIQDALKCTDGFVEARKILDDQKEAALLQHFSRYFRAINVLKHGRGRSYDELLAEKDQLPFKIKGPDENFFMEGDVAEVSTLIEVDDKFVMECANVIRQVSEVIGKSNPDIIW